MVDKVMENLDLTPYQAAVLVKLSDSQEDAELIGLAVSARLTPSQLSEAVAALEEKKLVTRTEDGFLRLTRAGAKLRRHLPRKPIAASKTKHRQRTEKKAEDKAVALSAN